VVRIDPQRSNLVSAAPPVFINRIRIAGEDVAIAETGTTEVAPLELSASRNNILIGFAGLSFRSGTLLRYEYMLHGINADWVAAGGRREVNYANLGAGSYRFSVRSINANGVPSLQPATFAFEILPPLYLRWWFIAAVSVVIAFVIYGVYRNRLERLLAIERTRTRIATDLHDDIGSDLSKISLLSDIVRVQLSNEPEERDRILGRIADISRASVDAMRDIVWAIDPKRDSVREMTRRMRKHAEEVFVEKGVRVRFTEPSDGSDLRLAMDTRREVYLIFKEAINNAARHSGCSDVEIEFRVSGSEVYLKVADNGQGFEASTSAAGNGLSNMKYRAQKIGGVVDVTGDQGTVVELRAPAR
jgi:signal transduction histidine kinase